MQQKYNRGVCIGTTVTARIRAKRVFARTHGIHADERIINRARARARNRALYKFCPALFSTGATSDRFRRSFLTVGLRIAYETSASETRRRPRFHFTNFLLDRFLARRETEDRFSSGGSRVSKRFDFSNTILHTPVRELLPISSRKREIIVRRKPWLRISGSVGPRRKRDNLDSIFRTRFSRRRRAKLFIPGPAESSRAIRGARGINICQAGVTGVAVKLQGAVER